MSDPGFARQITESQQRLFGYIYSLLGNNAASWDVLQETNLVLWNKQAEFQSGTNFFAWAATVARFQVMAWLRDRSREPLSVLTPELLDILADDAEHEAARIDQRGGALKQCLARLGEKGRSLVQLYYKENLSTEQIGQRIGSNPNAVKQALFRVRRKLQVCIETTITG